jgi:phosphomannomutase
MIKALLFDMDGVLSPSRMPISMGMSAILTRLSKSYELGVITGGSIALIKEQVLDHTGAKINCFPTSGTQCYIWEDRQLKQIYAHQLAEDDKKEIIDALHELIKKFRIVPIVDDQIEDRKSQITFSALGRSAPLDAKSAYDSDHKKRREWVKFIQPKLERFDVRIGGTTSLDFTFKGSNKAHGLKEFLKLYGLNPEQVIFFGDCIFHGGNDYEVVHVTKNYMNVTDWNVLEWVLHRL